ncbi:Actin-like 6A [Geranomyces variabilis]|uniref:Actin-like 6A n=1 Tax=Geranomyces variabilis TaxID=109894 RepID=A0AAD5TFE2_9FUNG|nr:Actin-like 6A [Geranomyces variabilis]
MSTATYGGDEVSALVFDIGSSTSKVGYAGEDTPKAVFPSWVGYPATNGVEAMDVDEPAPASGSGGLVGEGGSGDGADAPTPDVVAAKKDRRQKPLRYVGETELYPWKPNVELKNPLKDCVGMSVRVYGQTHIKVMRLANEAATESGALTPIRDAFVFLRIVEDWDAYEALWDHAFARLRVESSEHPLLLSEPSWNPRESREKLIELAFETYDVPCFYLARSAVLAAFASGRSTALVLDSGGHMTCAVPVVDGYVLKKALQKQPYAGNFVSNQALLHLTAQGINVTPQYLVSNKSAVDAGQPPRFDLRERPNTSASYHKLALDRAVDEFKETVCHVSETAFNETALNARPVKNYEFPDGYNNIFGIERFKITESLFKPSYMLRDSQQPPDGNPAPVSITQLVQNSIALCDPDLRSQLYPNVVLTGASTLLPGFADRVHHELLSAAPGFKTKIQAAGQTTERRFSPWIGGSILASLGTFHQMWVSKEEYAEIGVNVEKRLH